MLQQGHTRFALGNSARPSLPAPHLAMFRRGSKSPNLKNPCPLHRGKGGFFSEGSWNVIENKRAIFVKTCKADNSLKTKPVAAILRVEFLYLAENKIVVY